MRMILGLDRPTSGAAPVNGRPYLTSPAPLAEVEEIILGLDPDATRLTVGR